MSILTTFFLGIIVMLIAVVPPGLINITAAKISLQEGRTRGVVFSIGAALVVMIQTYIAVIFARYLNKHPDVIEMLRLIALGIFIMVTIYFFFIAKKEMKPKAEHDIKSKKGRFLFGMFLSSINIFPVPFQAYMSITLASFGWLSFDKTSIMVYVIGAATGAFLTFYTYMVFFNKISNKKLTSQKNMNYIIGAITGLISVFTLLKILNDL